MPALARDADQSFLRTIEEARNGDTIAQGQLLQVRRRTHINEVNVRVGEHFLEARIAFDGAEVHLFAGRAEVAADAAPVASQFFRVTTA
jgi:hypothetical protein